MVLSYIVFLSTVSYKDPKLAKLNKQVEGLLQKHFIKENMISCVALSLLTSKKDEF